VLHQGLVYDPLSTDQFGLVEVKCPYSYRHVTPQEACRFCSTLVTTTNREELLKLRHEHLYYSQVQGQMAITGRKWCDFVIFTEKGLSVERIHCKNEIVILTKIVAGTKCCINNYYAIIPYTCNIHLKNCHYSTDRSCNH